MSVLTAACGYLGCVIAPKALTAPEILERAGPSVIRLEATLSDGPAIGIGFAVSETRIATHLDLIEGASRVTGRLADGSRIQVRRVVALDEARRLIVLDTEGARLRPLRIGTDERLVPGATLYALGDPQGQRTQVLEGSFRGRRRSAKQPLELLETSAKLTPGWTGAPLLDERGRVVGVATQTLASQAFGLGIPSRALQPLAAAGGQGASFDDFAAERRGGRPAIEADTAGEITRDIPDHPLSLLDGCEDVTLRSLASGIVAAIERGAPIYNRGDQAECFRVYERAALRLSSELAASCPGGSRALETGLRKAQATFFYRDKAWALRDAFDGLLRVARKRLSDT